VPAVPEVIFGVLDGRYELRELLGRGPRGDVLRGWDRRSGRDVAVRVLGAPGTRGPGEEEGERVLRAIAAMGAVDHPHVVKILDAGEVEDGRQYVVMELLAGESLAQTLARLRRAGEVMPLEHVVAIGIQLCGALQAAHGRRIVHGELAPSRIFFVKEVDGRTHVKLLDLGLGSRSAAQVSRAGSGYEAPEVLGAGSEGAVGPLVDLFSLGVILHECTTGSVPRGGSSEQAWVATVPMSRPSDGAPGGDLAAGLAAVISRATAPRPEDRHQSARALGEALATLSSELNLRKSRSGRRSGEPTLRGASEGLRGRGGGQQDSRSGLGFVEEAAGVDVRVVEDAVTGPPGGGEATTSTPWVAAGAPSASRRESRVGAWVAVALGVLVVAAWVWMPPQTQQGPRRAPFEIISLRAGEQADTSVVEVAAAPAVIGEVGVHAEEDGGEGGEARGSAAAAEDAAAEDAAAEDAAAADAAAAEAVARAESLCSSSLRKALEEGQSAVTKCLTGNGVMLEEGLSVSVSVSVSGAGGASVEVTRLSLPSGVQLDAAVKQRVKGCVVDALKEVGVGCSVAASRSKKYAF
jgi:hypothetical protein